MGKTDCFTQFYPILPNWFYPLGKTYMPTLVRDIITKLSYGRKGGQVRKWPYFDVRMLIKCWLNVSNVLVIVIVHRVNTFCSRRENWTLVRLSESRLVILMNVIRSGQIFVTSTQEVLWSAVFVGSFVCWLVRSLSSLWFLKNWKIDFHEILHRCSAYAPSLTLKFREVKVKVRAVILKSFHV